MRLSVLLFFLIFFEKSISQVAFPGAEGFGAFSSGGRGGKVIYVTNVNISGPGSLQDALNQDGARYILFKVSGIIPGTVKIPNGKGNFTIAGQTSPNGIIVRGLEMYNENLPSVSNIIIRHVRSRIGDRAKYPSQNWIAEDGITIGGVSNAIIDHCSFQHASDEAVDISRSRNITIQNCILGETLGGHADLGGMLINYSDATARLDSLSIHHNVWSRIGGRMPEISCETAYCNGKTINIELSNNLFWDPKIEMWYEGLTGFNGHFFVRMNAINNLFHASSSFNNGMYHFDLLNFSQNRLFFSGNSLNLYPQYSDYQLFYCCNDFNKNHPNTESGNALKSTQRFQFPNIGYHSVSELKDVIHRTAGAFPRDAMDRRMMSYISQNTIISLPVHLAAVDDAFIVNSSNNISEDTDNDGMPDYWEQYQGLNPTLQDHNGDGLSMRITGVEGYSNLECYLNCLSDALVSGYSSQECGIQGFPVKTSDFQYNAKVDIFPNPTDGLINVKLPENLDGNLFIEIRNSVGNMILIFPVNANELSVDLSSIPIGIYFLRVINSNRMDVIQPTRFVTQY